MTTRSRTRLDMRGWPESRVGRRAITFAGLSVAGIVVLVLGFALDIVEGVPRPTPDCKGWNHGHVLGAVERVNVQRNGAALATLL